jgi:hypothetical protein
VQNGKRNLGKEVMEAMRVYKLRSPADKTFYAAIVPHLEGVTLISTRSGKWAEDNKLHFADLLMPEQDLNDWDVEKVEDYPVIPDDIALSGRDIFGRIDRPA